MKGMLMIGSRARPGSGATAWALTALLLATGAPACGGSQDASSPAQGPQVSVAPGATNAGGLRVVALGDSLTAGLGLDPEEAYPALLQARLQAAGLPVVVVNAGVSGDTSAGGLQRLDWSLEGPVKVLILALGGNDALRGLGTDQLRSNLAAIIQRAQARGIAVILAGMEAPPNMGPAYTRTFRNTYRELAAAYHVAFLPFLLDGVAGVADLNQRDGIHPNRAGARRVADNLWPLVERAVKEALQ